MTLAERISAGEIIILDGAIGTELENRGVPINNDASWLEPLATHKDLVREIHEDYIRAGADVITTNTYASGRHAMEQTGYGDDFEVLNRRAVELASQARENASTDRPVYIAGSVAAFGNGGMKYVGSDGIAYGENDSAQLKENFKEQAAILADAGADLILVELFQAEPTDSILAVEGATECGLPVWVAPCSTLDPDTSDVIFGSSSRPDRPSVQDPGGLIRDLMAAGGDVLLLMHAELNAVEPTLRIMRENWNGPLGTYPNRTGYWGGNRWVFVEEVSPDAYADQARGWIDQGIQVVGGCCGFGPDHIAALRTALPSHI